ncbi:hypothetical protein [Acinetobacter sp. NS4_7]
MIKTKMQLAHEMALAIQGTKLLHDMELVSDMAWKYADAMQAEADKRNKAEAEQKRKEMREMLNAPNTFIEREGQHFDDVCSDEMQAQRDAELYGTGFLKVTYDSNGVKYERLDPETISMCSSNIGLDSQVLKEWQPDWSQAPEWAKYWAIREDSDTALWCINKPTVTDDCFLSHGCCSPAPSFGFTGSRIVERPQ